MSQSRKSGTAGVFQRPNLRRIVWICLAAGAPAAHSQNAQDQSAPLGTAASAAGQGATLEEVTVTATRRETSAQNTSIAITAISGEQLQALGISTPTDLDKLVPNLFVSQGYGAGEPRFSIRGLGASDYSLQAVSPVALYVDDVYQAYTFGVGTSLFDLERVEALRGPQGTLFGKNTTGGAINYFAVAPVNKEEGYLNVDGGGGQFDHFAAEGAINEPLIPDVLLSRLSVRVSQRGDYVQNTFDGTELGHREDYSARFQLQWLPGPATTVNLKVFGSKSNGDGPIYHGFNITNVCAPELGVAAYFNCAGGAPVPSIMSSAQTSSELRPAENYQNYGTTLHAEQRFSDYTLSSITNYTNVHYQARTNDDGTAADFFHSVQQMSMWQASQELRLASPVARTISGIVGVFAMYDSVVSPNSTLSSEPGPPFDYAQVERTDQDTTTYALFGSATWHIAQQWSLTAGLRESSERKKINLQGLDLNSGVYALSNYGVNTPGAISNNTLLSMDPANPPFQVFPEFGDVQFSQVDSRTFKKLTGDATLNYEVGQDARIYAKMATGFRSGGYNTYATLASTLATVNPETVRSYEVGWKTEWLERRLRVNGDVFYYNYSNQQVQSTVGSTAGTRLSNAGRSRIKGAELEVEAVPLPAVRLSMSAGYTDARYTQYNTTLNGEPISLAGNFLPYAPRFTATALGSYTWKLPHDRAFTAQTDWSYRDTVYYDPFNEPYTSDGTLFLGAVRFTLDLSAATNLYLYTENIGNRRYTNFAYFVAGLNGSEIFGERRTIGLGLRTTF